MCLYIKLQTHFPVEWVRKEILGCARRVNALLGNRLAKLWIVQWKNVVLIGQGRLNRLLCRPVAH
jgi:hypothetical protein